MKSKLKLNLSYLSSVLYRVLPNQQYNLSYFKKLYHDKLIKAKFNNVSTLQEYPGLYERFKSKGFDMSLANKIKEQVKNTKTEFFKQIHNFEESCCDRTKFKGLCGITQKHLDFICSRFMDDVFPNHTPEFTKPTIDEVLDQLNKKASMGLPNPFVKKGDVLDLIREYLEKFYNGTLRPSDIFTFPSAIFLRLQIRESGLKARVVHAVQGFQQALESFIFIYFSSGLPESRSAVVLGYTQSEISEVVTGYKGLYAYSVDYKVWDNSRQPVLSVISFELIRQLIPLTDYELEIFTTIRNLYLTLPSFHPIIELKRRYVGTVSGSGFTSLDNSLCNYIITSLIMYEYCLSKGYNPYDFSYRFNVSGDDMIMGCETPIDMELFKSIAYSKFGATVKLECEPSKRGEDRVTFLGSNWENGKPFRSEKLMVASCIFGSGNFPLMSAEQLLASRFLEIFGNSADCEKFAKKMNLQIPSRIFFFNELSNPFKSGSPKNKSERYKGFERNADIIKQKDSRGFFYNYPFKTQNLNYLWYSR